MKAKLAYLTTPAPGVFVLNVQTERFAGLMQFEISKAHLANILIDGTALALREQYPQSVDDRRTVDSGDDHGTASPRGPTECKPGPKDARVVGAVGKSRDKLASI